MLRKKLFLSLFMFTAILASGFFLKVTAATDLATKLEGKILLQVEDKGQAWYVVPGVKKRVYLGRPQDAFKIMQEYGLGVSNANYNRFNKYGKEAKAVKGKILLKVEDHGKAYYVNPKNNELLYMGRPADAFLLMKKLGLGIKDEKLSEIPVIAGQENPDFDEIQLDSDGDGIGDDNEEALDTNPDSSDTDGDGYDDYMEVASGYNPNGDGLLPGSHSTDLIKRIKDYYVDSQNISPEEAVKLAELLGESNPRGTFTTWPVYASSYGISAKEKHLGDIINDYRASRGLSRLPISKKLSFTAKTHLMDLTQNQPEKQKGCDPHSWSSAGDWTACCHNNKKSESSSCTMNKGQELTGYSGISVENLFTVNLDFAVTPEAALNGWIKSKKHHIVIINKDWAENYEWQALGIAMYGNYAAMYVGDVADTDTIETYSDCSTLNHDYIRDECYYNNASYMLDNSYCLNSSEAGRQEDCRVRTSLYECYGIKNKKSRKSCLMDIVKSDKNICSYVYKKPKQLSNCYYFNDYSENKNSYLLKLSKGRNNIYFNNELDQSIAELAARSSYISSISTNSGDQELIYYPNASANSTLDGSARIVPYQGYKITTSKGIKFYLNKPPGSAAQNLNAQLKEGQNFLGFQDNITRFKHLLGRHCGSYNVTFTTPKTLKDVPITSAPMRGLAYNITCTDKGSYDITPDEPEDNQEDPPIDATTEENYCDEKTLQDYTYTYENQYFGNSVFLSDDLTEYNHYNVGLFFTSDTIQNISVEELLGPNSQYGCAGSVQSVWKYDVNTDEWIFFDFDSPDFLNKLDTMTANTAYSIRMKNTCTLSHPELKFWKSDYCPESCAKGECVKSDTQDNPDLPDLLVKNIRYENGYLYISIANEGADMPDYFSTSLTVYKIDGNNRSQILSSSVSASWADNYLKYGQEYEFKKTQNSIFGTAGEITLSAVIDPMNNVEETNTTNNTLTKTVSPVNYSPDDKPDFYVSGIVLGNFTSSNDGSRGLPYAKIVVKNKGKGSSESPVLNIKLEDISNNMEYHAKISKEYFSSGFVAVSNSLSLYNTRDELKLRATVDYNNVFSEESENNNQLDKNFSSSEIYFPDSDRPDLVITGLEKTNSGINISMKNNGFPLYTGLPIQAKLSREASDSTYVCDHILSNDYSQKDSFGNNEVINCELLYSENEGLDEFASELSILIAEADPEKLILEKDELNNIYSDKSVISKNITVYEGMNFISYYETPAAELPPIGGSVRSSSYYALTPLDNALEAMIGDQLTGADNEADSDRVWLKKPGSDNYSFYWYVEYPSHQDHHKWYNGNSPAGTVEINPEDTLWVEVQEGHGSQNIHLIGYCLEDECK